MHKEIKKVEEYFKKKLINGDFKVKSIFVSSIDLVVDNKYEFSIWTIDGPDGIRTHRDSFMSLHFNNIMDKKSLWSHLEKYVDCC